MMRTASLVAAMAVAIGLSTGQARLAGQSPAFLRAVQAATAALSPTQSNAAALAELGAWSAAVDANARAGTLVRTGFRPDAMAAGRSHERFAQYHGGVPVFGGGLVRQLDQFGETVSIFGTVYEDIDIAVEPFLNQNGATQRLAEVGGGPVLAIEPVELTVLPAEAGYVLTWTGKVASQADGLEYRVFVDATTGVEVHRYIDSWTQIPTGDVVGAGTGVAGDRLKLSVQPTNVGYRAVDGLRRNNMTTYDLAGNVEYADQIRRGQTTAGSNDVATDDDNQWTDQGVISAHAYSGLTHDYWRQRFGWTGLDDQNRQVLVFVNPADPANFATQSSQYSLFFNNAFYSSSRTFYGVGSANWRNFAGALDVVAHELTHGVTAFTSNLIYRNESGALNEAFSDIMGASAEFYFQPMGTGLARADWLLGEDLGVTGGFIRSMSNPPAGNDPHHYSNKFTGPGDNGGVHINSGIINYMFYLAVVGGTHSVSGLTVQGRGMENRAEVERVIFRAFTEMLPPGATFAMARAATIQAARDLFGAGSAVESTIVQAWNAVGVF